MALSKDTWTWSMIAVTVCVNFNDYLSRTFPQNRPLFDDYIIVTAPGDPVIGMFDCKYHVTDVFYARGAIFNKGAAIDGVIRDLDGWICLLDADIVIGRPLPVDLDPRCIYSPYRSGGPERRNGEFAGYMQVFHGPRRYPDNWIHAGGSDSMFYRQWPPEHRIRWDWEVCHLGDCGKNWYGRGVPMPDLKAQRKKFGYSRELLE